MSVPHLTTPGQGLTPVLSLPQGVLAPSPGPGGQEGSKVDGPPKMVKMEANNEDSNDWTGIEQYPSENSQEKTSFEQVLYLSINNLFHIHLPIYLKIFQSAIYS